MPTAIKPPFKSKTGGWYTSALFLEYWRGESQEARPIEPVFSFQGKEGYIDARRTFVELMDPTGYKWSQKYLKSWDHFEALLRCKWFFTEYQSWLNEIKTVLKSKAITKIKEIADSDAPQALAANRYLSTADWEKGVTGRGRPSREEVTGELKKQAAILSDTNEDAQRIGLTVIAGGKA